MEYQIHNAAVVCQALLFERYCLLFTVYRLLRIDT
jgi:hypothetical protein